MIQNSRNSSGVDYTATVAYIVVALAVTPAVCLVSGPLETSHILAALTIGMGCLALAWNRWTWHSELSIPSINGPFIRSR